MKRKTAQLKSELGREPTREEIAAAMKITVADVEDLEMLEEQGRLAQRPVRRRRPGRWRRRSATTISPSVEYQIIKSSIQNQIRDILGELDEKEALVLKLRFGLDDDQPRTLQEIGDRART